MADNENENQNTGSEEVKTTGNKLEHPESIPTAGGKQLGEEHMGESKRLGENERSQSEASGADIQRQLEGKKKPADSKNEGGEKHGALDSVKEKLGMGKKE